MEFEWDVANTEHVARHGLVPVEVEQVFADPHALSMTAYQNAGEERFGILGATEDDRVLMVIYTWRGAKVRVVTAFPSTARQQRIYNAGRP